MRSLLENDEEIRKDRELLNEITSCDLEELCRRQRGVIRNFLQEIGNIFMGQKLNLLFLCTGNSCRSQMAEGWARKLKSDRLNAYSAGIETHGLNPNAVKVMAEVGVDITEHRSQQIDAFAEVPLDVVVTVCSHAHETCPIFPGDARVVHVGFEDPPKMARALATQGASEEKQLDCYRKVRDEIRAFVATLPESLKGNTDE